MYARKSLLLQALSNASVKVFFGTKTWGLRTPLRSYSPAYERQFSSFCTYIFRNFDELMRKFSGKEARLE